MSGEPTTSALRMVGALSTTSGAWPDELWAGSVGIFDALLRSWHGVYEFTDDPACVFRVGMGRARAAVSLSDGTKIATDEVIGTLHFWNEHLPRYPASGPDLRWACTMRDQVAYSLCLLAEHLESEPEWREVPALRGDVALGSRIGMSQVARVVVRFGFERVPSDPELSLRHRLHVFCESFTLWGLTRAFQPAALPRRPFLREQQELWISRARLLGYARRHAAMQAKATQPRAS